MKIYCAVVDDEPLAVELMESYISRTPFLELTGSYTSSSEALEALRNEPVDLLFCDINMPGLTGMDLVSVMPEETKVVFVTAYSEYALEGFRHNALDYLLKPVSYQDFLKSADRAFKWFSMAAGTGQPSAQDTLSARHGGGSFFVKSEYRTVRIFFDELIAVEGMKDYVKFHIQGEDLPVLSIMSMKAVEEILPHQFMRVHRSFIVNTDRIRIIEKGRLLFGKLAVPVSDSCRKALSERLGHSL